MQPASSSSRCSIARRQKRSWLRWEIHTWPVISRRSRTICARFPTRRFPRSAPPKPFLARFRFAGTSQSPFRISRSAEQGSSGPRRSPREALPMRRIEFSIFMVAFAVIATLLWTACSVNVKKEKNGDDKQVDIQTPVGGIHVSKDADPADAGLAVYPGAHLKPKDASGDDKSANVNLSGFGF